jgi:hypothetical protein
MWRLILFIFSSITIGLLPVNAHTHRKDSEFLRAMDSGALTKIIISTSDDDNVPISNVSVRVLMGMEYREDAYFINGKTDKDGKFVIEGITKGNEIEITATKDGYYRSFKKLCYIRMGEEYEVKDGKWQPWGLKISLPLREKRNQASLIRKYGGVDMPTTNQWFGFDMKIRDWVAPGHAGIVPDFEVYLTWDGKPIATSAQTDLLVRFIEDGAGYYLTDKTVESDFKGVYNANTNTIFKKEFTCSTFRKNGRFTQIGIPSDKIMIIRSRCKVDKAKNIIEANYSSATKFFIEGGWHGKAIMDFSYYFNPIPNNTNLEAK